MFSSSCHKIAKNKVPLYFIQFLLLFLFVSAFLNHAQEPNQVRSEQLILLADTSGIAPDSILVDSAATGAKKIKKNVLEAPVSYASQDSFIILVGEQKTFLYKDGSVDYQNISLKADYIDFNLGTSTVLATGMVDTAGLIAGKPVFTQGEEELKSDTIRYNFKTHKGIIKYIITKQGEGYLHSARTKRLEDGEIHISKGKYTTCDEPHPHFYIRLTKAIAIPQKKIVSGPAYMVLEDIPLPLALPFGFFPNTTTRSSGLIIPTYGEELNRGFYLRDGGWYFALSDHVDFTVLGRIYSRGTWGITALSDYKVRYRYSGRFNIEYVSNRVNDDPTFKKSRDFKISWTHTQDAKANPSRQFSASVNFTSSAYDKNQSYNINDYLTNTKNSSISYRKSWPGTPFNMNANLQHSQNSRNKSVDLTLPVMTFNMNSIYPFRGKNDNDGDYNWLENIQISYKAMLKNRIKATDSTLFASKTLENMENGFSHSLPISLDNIKLFKFINISPGLSYNGVLYTKYIVKRPVISDTTLFSHQIETDTIQKVTYAHSMATSLGISASPKLYGTYQSIRPNSYIAAIRHVMTPSVSVSFSPDMSKLMPDYYQTVVTGRSIAQPVKYTEYSIYEGQPFGTPSVKGRSGSVSLGLRNNLEMKVRAKNDTTGELKKVSILDNLNFSASYNPFAKTFHWSSLNMTGSTKLFSKKVDIQFGATFNPYALDSAGTQVIDKFLIREKGKLFRTTRAYVNMGFNLKSSAGDKKAPPASLNPSDETADESNTTLDYLDESAGYYGEYVDFDVPWSLSLTPKWKIGLNSGYDFVKKDFSTTNFSIHRDLHCWDMRFTVVPFGDRRSYSFTISAKNALLRDLKYNKRRSWFDNF